LGGVPSAGRGVAGLAGVRAAAAAAAMGLSAVIVVAVLVFVVVTGAIFITIAVPRGGLLVLAGIS